MGGCVCCVGGWVVVVMDVCVRVYVSASAILCIRNYVSYTSWKRFIHIVELPIIISN